MPRESLDRTTHHLKGATKELERHVRRGQPSGEEAIARLDEAISRLLDLRDDVKKKDGQPSPPPSSP